MHNPYSSPNDGVVEAAGGIDSCAPRLFSLDGRIGRLRYVAYTLELGVMLWGLMLAIYGTTSTGIGTYAFADAYLLSTIPMMAVSVVMTRRRLNDLDYSGWFAFLTLVPFVNFPLSLYLTFRRGTEGQNRHGLEPAPNPPYMLAYCCILPIVFLILIKMLGGSLIA